MDGCLFRGMLLMLLFLPGPARADAVNSEWFSTTRSLSMGNVGIASADDPSTAAFYNPAALAKSRKPVLDLFNPQLELGSGLFSLSNKIADWGKLVSVGGAKPFLKDKPGTASSMGFAFYPNLSAQNFSFGVLYSGQSYSYYDLKTDSYVRSARRLLIPSLGISASIMGSKLRIGAAVRGVQISSTDTVEHASSSSTVTEVNNSRDGFGVALDGGVMMMLPWAGLPTLGLVARNVGGTNFTTAPLLGGGEKRRQEAIKMSYDGGFSIAPKMGRNDHLTFAIDYRDFLNSTKTVPARKFNLGFEYVAARFFALRSGFSQGTWTAGIGFNGHNGALDIGSSGAELDPHGYRVLIDRRYSLRFSRRF